MQKYYSHFPTIPSSYTEIHKSSSELRPFLFSEGERVITKTCERKGYSPHPDNIKIRYTKGVNEPIESQQVKIGESFRLVIYRQSVVTKVKGFPERNGAMESKKRGKFPLYKRKGSTQANNNASWVWLR